ncbi:hypothetical protein FcAc13_06725 [Frischella sp. Ac13]|uniref:Uncharacterized protein n=1 Tax=Frischella japonica TaxID=2741544 RepID=A0ABR7QXT2_9GAMM|nr:hypothetical protein [Frischella japonica]MBC9131004.1 hypothetical protein [Frischella japonica]
MKRKIFNYVIFLITFFTSVFVIGNDKVEKVTDFEIGATFSIVPYGGVGGTSMIDTGVTIENGDIWIWGFRNAGISGLGHNPHNEASPPQRVQKFLDEKISITQAVGGAYHILALDDKGDVWGWGQNGFFEAGAFVCRAAYINTPCRILEGQSVIQIGAGEYVSMALTKSGEVYTWGHSIYGQTGNGTLRAINGIQKIPQEYFNNQAVVLIGSAYEGGYAVNASGQIFGWGDDQHNSFGYENGGAHVYRDRPVPLNIQVDGHKVEYICGGEGYTEYLLDNGEVWGIGNLKMLGKGYGGLTAVPVMIMSKVKTLYCRYISSLAITSDNDIYTWGAEGYDIGGGVPIKRNHYDTITKVDGGKHHLIYWTDKGDVYGVGYGAAHKFGRAGNIGWPGRPMSSFVVNQMKKAYGDDYIAGQGK